MPRRQTPRLSDALAQYLQIRSAHVAPSTLANDQALLRKFCREVGDPQTHLLTAQHVELWFVGEAARQKASSYNKVRTRVRGFLDFCTRRGWLTSDPLAEVRTRRVPQADRLRLSRAQIRALIECTDNPRDRAMLATACNTGLRASDLVALRVRDVDLDAGVICVVIKKTGDVDRLPITSDLDSELRSWLTWYSERLSLLDKVLEPESLLFPALGYNNVRHGRKIHLYGDPQVHRPLAHPARVVQRALERIDIHVVTGEGFHTLRRSVGRLVFEQASESGHDAALRLTAALLGHKSTQTTEGYIGVSADRRKRDELLKGKSFLDIAPTGRAQVIPLQRTASDAQPHLDATESRWPARQT